MPSMWMVPGFSAARLGTLAGVSFSSRPSATAGIMTGSSIMTTERYCLSLFFCIFSRLTSERVPSNTTLQEYFFSTTGAITVSTKVLWLAAPPTTTSLVWARRRRGAENAAVAAPAAARIVRRFKARGLVLVMLGSPGRTRGKQGPCLGVPLQPRQFLFQLLDALRELVDRRRDLGLAVARHDVLAAIGVPRFEGEDHRPLGLCLVGGVDQALHQREVALDHAGAAPQLHP